MRIGKHMGSDSGVLTGGRTRSIWERCGSARARSMPLGVIGPRTPKERRWEAIHRVFRARAGSSHRRRTRLRASCGRPPRPPPPLSSRIVKDRAQIAPGSANDSGVVVALLLAVEARLAVPVPMPRYSRNTASILLTMSSGRSTWSRM